MRYTVVWHDDAVNELANLWMSADDPDAVTKAVGIIDERLCHEMTAKGVEVSEGLLALWVPPLRVLYSISHEDRLVEVLMVRAL